MVGASTAALRAGVPSQGSVRDCRWWTHVARRRHPNVIVSTPLEFQRQSRAMVSALRRPGRDAECCVRRGHGCNQTAAVPVIRVLPPQYTSTSSARKTLGVHIMAEGALSATLQARAQRRRLAPQAALVVSSTTAGVRAVRASGRQTPLARTAYPSVTCATLLTPLQWRSYRSPAMPRRGEVAAALLARKPRSPQRSHMRTACERECAELLCCIDRRTTVAASCVWLRC